MSSSAPPTKPDQALVSVRPRLRAGGRGGSVAGDGGVAGSVHENIIPSQLSAPKYVPPRPPLTTGLSSAPPPPPYSGSQPTTRPDSCPGPVQQLLHQQLAQKMPMMERDRQIAMVEEELKLTRKMLELERRENEVARQVEEQRKNKLALSGFGRFGGVVCESETSEDMFKQMETARQKEHVRLTNDKLKDEGSCKNNHTLPNNEVTKKKVREMLERKKREMVVKNGTNSSDGSSLKDLFLKKTEVQKGGHDVFISDEENEQVAITSKPMHYDDLPSLEIGDLTSVLGDVIPDQEMIWERIQREKREEERRMGGMKHNEVVREQEEILRKIQEQNLTWKKEEELTLKLIAEMSLNDRRQQQQLQHQLHSNGALTAGRSSQAAAMPRQDHPRAATALPASARDIGEDWRVVGARVKERVASLKIAAELDNKRRETAVMEDWRREMLEREEEERRRQLRKWGVNQKVRVVKSVESFQEDVEDSRSGTTFRDILLNKNIAELNKKPRSFKTERRTELVARRKSEGGEDISGERKKAAEDLKTRIVAQEKDLRARVEKEALEREWELATRRRETRGGSVPGQERTGHVSRQTRLEQNMNQKMRKQK